jgi:hypothetical protein
MFSQRAQITKVVRSGDARDAGSQPQNRESNQQLGTRSAALNWMVQGFFYTLKGLATAARNLAIFRVHKKSGFGLLPGATR